MLLQRILESEALSTAIITLFIAALGYATLKIKNAAQGLHASMELVKASLNDQREDIKQAKEQVSNNHGTNLRDDLDGFRAEFKLEMNDMRQIMAKREAADTEREARAQAWQSTVDDRLLLLDQKVENFKAGSSRTHDRIWQAISQIEHE